MKYNNLSMNIYEAVVLPIAAFVYFNRYALPAGARLNAPVDCAHNDANTFDRQLNSADRWSSAKII